MCRRARYWEELGFNGADLCIRGNQLLLGQTDIRTASQKIGR